MSREKNILGSGKPHVMRAKQAAAYLGVCPKTIWLWAKTGRLPRPIRQGKRCSVWKTEDLDNYLDRCASGEIQ